MERMTEPGAEGIKAFCDGCVDGPHHVCADKDTCDIPKIYATLQSYENTGLTPEEIAGLQEALGGKEVADWAVEAVACRKEAAAANLERFRLQKENQRLRSVLYDIYPAIAGRVLALEQAGETVAHERWAEMARKIHEVLEVDKS